MFQEKEEFFLVTIHALSYHQFCSVFSCVCVIYLDFLWIFLFSVDLGDFQKKPKFTDFSTSCSKCFWKDLRWFHCDLAILWFFAVWKICGSLRFVAGKITLAICWIFCGQKDFIFVPIFRDHKIHEKQITKNPTLILLFLHFGFLRIYLVLCDTIRVPKRCFDTWSFCFDICLIPPHLHQQWFCLLLVFVL